MIQQGRMRLPGTAPDQAFHDHEGFTTFFGRRIKAFVIMETPPKARPCHQARAGWVIPGHWKRAYPAEQADRLRTSRLSTGTSLLTAAMAESSSAACHGCEPLTRTEPMQIDVWYGMV
jgi:hypothetical protein